ncbi:MAG: hypothetical protein M1838_000624 [Thelocarpon superellum]|nr:MAG: hypothetical protein M1838_000624 [Thelocarpon superellum]
MSTSTSNTIVITTTGCPAYVDGYDTSYNYVPSRAAGIAFVTLFSLATALHTIQFIWKRQWWCSVFAIGALTEVIGWAGRLWSANCPYNKNAFLMQISTLIIAPTFFTAGIYIILGRMIKLVGPHTSPISPRTYLFIFCTCDVISLVVQAVGGGLASVASNSINGNTKPGTNAMVAGIVFQMASITVFLYFFVTFCLRAQMSTQPSKLKVLLVACCFSVTAIYIRSIYRTIELAQGWSGYLITHESYFIGLDGAMMIFAVTIFNVVHPGWFLSEPGAQHAMSTKPQNGLQREVGDMEK